LRILVIALIFGYLALITGAFLNAVGEQKKQTMLMALVLATNIIANLILIPRYGIVGAAVSALIGNVLLWSVGYLLVRRLVKIQGNVLWKYCLRALIPALAMGAIILWLSGRISVIFAIPLGGAIYFVLLFATGGINREIIGEIKTKLSSTKQYENPDYNA
jgi:O-antigen/teichoic acid export membrane protein